MPESNQSSRRSSRLQALHPQRPGDTVSRGNPPIVENQRPESNITVGRMRERLVNIAIGIFVSSEVASIIAWLTGRILPAVILHAPFLLIYLIYRYYFPKVDARRPEK